MINRIGIIIVIAAMLIAAPAAASCVGITHGKNSCNGDVINIFDNVFNHNDIFNDYDTNIEIGNSETNNYDNSVTNNYDNSVTNNIDTDTTTNNIDNSDNSVTTNIDNSDNSVTKVTEVSVTNVIATPARHEMLDTGVIDTRVVSIYSGRALVYPLQQGRPITAGNQYNVSYKAACPLLIYVVSTNDKDKVNLKVYAPVFDDIRGIFSHQGLYVIRGSLFDPLQYEDIISTDPDHSSLLAEDISTQNHVWFTIPDNGYYSVVFDTRPSQHRNGLETEITDATCDAAFRVMWSGYDESYNQKDHGVIGVTSVYPVDSNGTTIIP